MTGENTPFPEPSREPVNGDNFPYAQEEQRWVRDILDEAVELKLIEHEEWVAHVPATPEDNLSKDVLVLSSLSEQEELILITVVAFTSLSDRPKAVSLAWLTGDKTGTMSAYVEDITTGVVVRSDTRSEETEMQVSRIKEILENEGGDIENSRMFIDAGKRFDKEEEPNRELAQSLGLTDLPISLKDMRWLEGLIATGEPVPPEQLGYTRP